MPLFWFDENDIGDHGDVDTLIAYLDDIGQDELADDIHYARGENDEFGVAVIDGLEALDEVTVPGLAWALRGGRLTLD